MRTDDQLTNRSNVLLFTLLVVSFVVAYFPVWKRLVWVWMSYDEYSHGFLIIPLCCYILWRKKESFAQAPIKPSPWGLGLAILSLLLYIFAHFAEILTLASFSMVLLPAGIIIYFYGFFLFKELLFPFLLLLFMIPIPSQIYASLTIPLQLFVSKTSVWIAVHLSLPIYREGNVIYLPDLTLQVVQACSGLRSMISLLALALIFGYFTLKSNSLRILLFISAVPTAVFVNIARVLLLVLAFHLFNYDLTKEPAHTVFGIFVFILALILIAISKGILSIWDRSIPSK